MRLAEALAERSDAQKRLEQLKARAVACARYQEGEEPVEDPAALHEQAREVIVRIEELVRQINRTNSATELEPGLTITNAIAHRDGIASRRKLTVAIADAAVGREDLGWLRRSRSELRYVTDLPVTELRSEADRLAKEYRELDTRIQEANWTTDLNE